MYRYATKTTIDKPILCTSPDCESIDGALSTKYIKKFRIDFVVTGKKEVAIQPNLFLTEVCTRCFLKIIESEINKLDIVEQLR